MSSTYIYIFVTLGVLLSRGVGAGVLTGVTITGHDDGYIPLESGTCDACSATISVSYTPSSAGTIVFSSDVGDLVNQAISTGTSNYNVVSESFSGPGTYSLNITVSLEADSYMLPLKVVVETQLAGFQAEMTSRYIVPYEEFAISATVESGTNILFTIDLENNIKLLKSCDGNSLEANITYSYNETGTYDLAIMASNFISYNSSSFVLTVMYKLNSFIITQTSMNPITTTQDLIFTIFLDSSAKVPMGNLTITVDVCRINTTCDNGSAIPLDINPGGSYVLHMNISVQGKNPVLITIANAFDKLTVTHNVFVWDLLRFSLCVSSNYLVLGEEAPFFFDGPLPPSGFQYKIDFGNGVIKENNSEDIFYSAYIPIDLTGITYNSTGNYSIHFEASNTPYSIVQDIQVSVLIPVGGMTVEWGNATISNGTNYVVTINVTQGTDVLVGVNFYETFVMNKDCYYLQAEHIFNNVGTYTLEAFASNPVKNISKTFEIEVIYDLNGFSISVEQTLLQTNENISFSVKLDQTAKVPMGNLNISIEPCNTNCVTESVVMSPDETRVFVSSFASQGNYSVTLTIMSPLGTEVSTTVDIYIWDILNVTLSVSDNMFAVGFQPSFEIIDPPPSGFMYAIDFGESTVLNEADPAIMASPYSSIMLPSSFNYNAPGEYTVSFKAFNNFYMVFNNLCVNAQYRLPDSYLLVNPLETYVIPDDTAIFEIFSNSNSTVPKPTNVTCNIDYGDGTALTDVTTEFDYDDNGLGRRLEHNYTTAGTYNVIINCSNLISKLVFTATIKAIEFSADSFNLSYRRVNLHNESQSGLLEVELQLYDLKTPPKNIKLDWNFGDNSGTDVDDPMTTFSKRHTYNKRGNYSGVVKITYAGYTADKSFDVRMGAFEIKLVTEDAIGLVSVNEFNFKIFMYLTGENTNGEVIWGDGTQQTYPFGASEDPQSTSINHIFATAGILVPKIKESTDIGYEYSSLELSITIQHVVQNLSWVISPNVILLSPFSPIIVYSGNEFLRDLTCFLNYADGNMTMENVTFTSNSPEVSASEYSYVTQGERSISVTCSNTFTSQTLNATIQVFSGCFNSGNMFETTYRSVRTPLKAFMSSIPVISGRVEITAKCENSTDITYVWIVEKQDDTEPTGWKKLNVTTPNAKVYDLAISNIEPGIFRLTCNLTVVATKVESIEDYMYIELINPPLVVKITGGTRRILGKTFDVSLDAVSNSYDPIIGYGKENYLSLSWSCYQVPESDLDNYFMPQSTDITYRSKPSCGIVLSSDGIITVSATSLVLNGWSLFEANVTKDTRAAVTFQAIKIVEVPPPQITLTCKWNCELKKSRMDRMMYEATVTCPDCSAAHLASATYEWTFYKYNGNAYDLLDNTGSHFLSASSKKLFDLDGGFMDPGASYKLKLTVTVGNLTPGSSEIILSVNQEPYDGACVVSPLEGTATLDDFTFSCRGWKDEGTRFNRDPNQDGSEPLNYVIKQFKGNTSQIIYTGNEASAVQTLEVCPEEDSYMCTIEFRIVDAFKSEAIFLVNVTVTNPIPNIQFNTFGESDDRNSTNGTDSTTVFTNFMDRTITEMVTLTKTNDPEKTIKVATSYMSAINTVVIQQITGDDVMNISVGVEITNLMGTALDRFTTEDPQTTKLLETTEVITNTMLSSITDLVITPFTTTKTGTDGNVLPNSIPQPDVVIMLSTSLATALNNPTVVQASIVSNAAQGIGTLSDVFITLMNNTRNPVDIERAIEAIGMAQSNLNKNVAEMVIEDYIEDLDGMDTFVTRELNEGEKRFNAIERRYMRKVAEKKKEVKREKMLRNIKEIQESFKKTTENMFLLMDKLLEDGGSKTLENENFALSLEKKTVTDLVKSDRNPVNGVNFALGGIAESVLGDESVKLYVKVIKKNIYIQGNNAKYIDGPVTVVSVKKDDGSSLTISEPLIKQTDPVEAPRKVIYPHFVTGDAAKLFYHSFFYKTLHADICLSALPFFNVKVVYDLYFRSILPPTDMEFDHYEYYDVSAGVSGTKYCVRAGALKRTGIAYVALRPRLNEAVVVSRKKRSAPSNETTAANSILETPYLFRLSTITCFSWDGQVQDWRSTTCKLQRDDDKNETTCICPNTKEIVASVSFFVPPNAIEFSTVFSKFDVAGQGAVIAALILIFAVFIMAALFSRYKDGQDVLQWGVSMLEDNFCDDCYFYLITVYTGMIRHGGTRSTIEFSITGEEADSGIRVLTDGVRKEFGAGSVLHFIMAVPLPLGTLQCLRVWHDNSGKGKWASWYLNRIEVIDLQTKERFDFLCYKWLSFEAGNIEAILGVGSSENMKNFKTMFFEHARVHVTDDHLWLSTVLRPVKSHFSRVQRVGCCLAFLLLAMISNAMFYQKKEFKNRQQPADFELGPFKFSITQLWISFVSSLITAIPIFVMMLLFRKSKLSKRQLSNEGYTSHWMLPCFKRFKFYKDSVALQKVLVIKDIVDDEEGVLPHFCVYIGWVLIGLASVASAFFVLLYSAEWGKEISEQFLITFFMSFAESMFILDPFKIVFLAIIFAIILKNIKVVRPTVFDLKHIYEMNTRIGKQAIPRKHLDYRSPFPESEIEEVKFKVKQRSKMHKAISEFIVTVFLLILLCSIAYSQRDPHGFLLRTNLENQLFRPIRPVYKPGVPTTPSITTDTIHTVREYYMWLNYTVMDAMFPEENFDNHRLGPADRLMMSDLSNIRIGSPRLRLVRQQKTSCTLPYLGNVGCTPRYSVTSEDIDDYCEGWNTTKPCNEDEGLRLTNAAWTYVPAWKIWGIPIAGSLNVYGGGGYIVDLDIMRPVAKRTVSELIDSMWINRETRAVFLEFTVYSPNLNMFAYLSLLAEFPETGAVLHYRNIFTFRSLQLTGTLGNFILVCEIFFLITTIVWVVVIAVRLLKERWSFFTVFWNIVELATVILSFAAVVLYFIRLMFTMEALAKYKDNPRIFINFYHISVWDGFFIYVVAILTALVTLRLIKVMGLTKVTRTVFTVLKQSSKTLPGFFFYIFLILLAFAACGTLFFGPFAKEYKDLITCLESLFSGVLGHAGFTKMNIPAESSWFGLIYFITFIIIVTFTLANIFMTILLDTMDMLAQDHSADRDLELTTYLWHSAKEIISGKKTDGYLKAQPDVEEHTVTITSFRQLLMADVKKRENAQQ